MSEFTITLDELAAEMTGETVQDGDIVLSDFIKRTGKSWNACRRFLAAKPGLREMRNVYSPLLGKRVTIFRPKVSKGVV